MSEPLNIREAEERARSVENTVFGATPLKLQVADDLLALAVLYREAVEALEDAASELHGGLPDDAEQTIDVALTKARTALGGKP